MNQKKKNNGIESQCALDIFGGNETSVPKIKQLKIHLNLLDRQRFSSPAIGLAHVAYDPAPGGHYHGYLHFLIKAVYTYQNL